MGMGVNDSDYATGETVDGKFVRCPYYAAWSRMLERCYSAKYHVRKPTYIGCTVCDEWLSFMAFRAWMIEQPWKGNQLDKDIIQPGNKVYSPDMCVFVSANINALIGTSPQRDMPIGVSLIGGKYSAQCMANGVINHLGHFHGAHEAGRVYSEFKYRTVMSTALKQSDRRVFFGLIRHAKSILDSGRKHHD